MSMEGLSVICAGLGSIEEDEEGNRIGYEKGECCLDNLKDLLRFLRRDDPLTRDVFKQVCKWNIVAKHLIPIIEHCQDDRNLVLNSVKVLVFLTMPIEVVSKDANEQLEYLWDLKSAITCSDIIAVIVSLLEQSLENLEREAFTEDDWKLVQLVLTLFRNILAVQDIAAPQKGAGSANHFLSLRDDFLEPLFRENVMDLIIVLTQHVGGPYGYLRQDNLLLLETFHYIFMGQDPELIAKACWNDSEEAGDAKDSLESLKSIMEEEKERKKATRLCTLARHSQFIGTFTRVTMDGSKTLCKARPSSTSSDALFKPQKVHRGPSKRVVGDLGRLPTTRKSILDLLCGFMNQFLSGGYNVLMQSIREDIEKEHHAIQKNDIVIFFRLAQFVTSFQCHKFSSAKPHVESSGDNSVGDIDDTTWFRGDICGPIAATMNESMFELVIGKWHHAFEGLKETNDYKFLSVAGSLMKIMIRLLDLVLEIVPEYSKETQTAHVLLYKLFYDQTEQGLTQFLLNLIRSFDAHKQPKSDLADLVEMAFVVIRLMENLQAHGTLRVSRKAKRGRRKKPVDEKKSTVDEQHGDQATVNNEIRNSGDKDCPDALIPEEENITETATTPFQTDVPETSMSVGQNLENSLPQVGDGPTDEHDTTELEGPNPKSSQPIMDDGESNQLHDNFVDVRDDADFSADEQLPLIDEVDFKISTLLTPLATSTIIKNLCWLLKFYKSNSASTNHYIICLFWRICDDLNLSPMLYQLSCLIIFYGILEEQKACPSKDYEEIVDFLTTLVRRMLRKMKSQPLLFVEILFWKTRGDCHYINAETMERHLSNMKKEVKKWRYDSDVGEAGPSHGQATTRRSIADALGDDEFDVIVPHNIYDDKEEDLEEAQEEAGGSENNKFGKDSAKADFERNTKRKKRLILNEELEEKLRVLYEKYKDMQDCSRLIAEALDPDGNISPAQVSSKCRKLGLQLPSKKRIRRAHLSDGNDESNGYDHLEETSSQRSLSTRKRVRAFDENQEQMIRSLFEQFKDHKRCAHMIADVLNPDGTVTAAQVSRKLKQLGLHVPRQRKQKAVDKASNNVSTDEEKDSDNLPLSSLRKRSKSMENARSSNDKALEQNGGLESPPYESDDEMLSYVLKKSRKAHLNKEEKLPSASIEEPIAENESQNEFSQLAREKQDETKAAETYGDSGGETNPSNNRGERILTPGDENDDMKDDREKYDELADSGDETHHSASPKSLSKRRKLRMVLDLDDDDD